MGTEGYSKKKILINILKEIGENIASIKLEHDAHRKSIHDTNKTKQNKTKSALANQPLRT